MKQTTEMGTNKTGIQTSHKMTQEMITVDPSLQAPIGDLDGSMTEMREFRKVYIQESSPVGTLPVPGTIKGAANAGMQVLKGNDPVILLDKLGERLAFERSGVRLYDGLIEKCKLQGTAIDITALEQIRREEAEHFGLVKSCLEKLGADPTAQTPSADAIAVSSQGLFQVVYDPRTTVEASIQAIHAAELIDNDCWDMLIKLADDAGLDEMVQQFTSAAANEARHLEIIRALHESLLKAGPGPTVQ